MRSSDVDEPREADMAEGTRLADALTQEEVEALIPHEPTWRYWLRRIDLPVQFLRIGILFLLWWLWWSEVLWNGWDSFSVFGVKPFPNVPETFRASPYETWVYFTEIYHEQLFWQDLWVTVKEALIGFVLGSLLGLIVGIVLGRFQRAARTLGPFVVIVNAMPKIAFLPLILIVYGVGEMSKVVLAVLIVFFIVEVPTQSAVALVDPDLDLVSRTMGASQRQRFMKVTLPGITPAVFGALRLSAVISVLAVVFGEIFSAKRGLGQRLITAANQLSYGDTFAIVFILALIALIMNGGIGFVERKSLRWQTTQEGGQVISL
ncbi:MAG: ABC transporter permease [Acidimicrobiia bacterium]|nr:ABC transporter permease [Acidimicrobiia bacterium]MYC45490.1 ABC transporter permease [Acidimicrobiia bacterium]